MITLPMERSEVDKRWISQKFGMIGGAGIGKSEFWSPGERTLYIQTESGLNHLAVKKLVCRSWAEWEAIYSALFKSAKEGKFPYDTIIVDTIDKFVDIVNENVIARGKAKFKAADISVIGDIPNGAGWAWSTSTVENTLKKLELLPAAIVYIGHLDKKEIKQPNGVSLHLQTISLGGKTGRELVHWPDHFINIESKMVGNTPKRTLRTLPSNTVEAKSRGGVVPHGMEWGSNTKENYAKFRALFT